MAIDPATATVSAIWIVLIRVAVGGGESSISRCPGLLETGSQNGSSLLNLEVIHHALDTVDLPRDLFGAFSVGIGFGCSVKMKNAVVGVAIDTREIRSLISHEL